MARIKQVFTVLASLSAGLILSAQELPVYSVTCPEASGLGEYGEVPVSHFTGIPNISVPLYEIRYGDYTIPVAADYHLASVRPGTPPGSLGIGWTLRAGGVISRTVRGVYDEKKASAGSGNGFYWNTAGLKSVSTDGFDSFAEQTCNFLQSETPEGWHELSADEFSFSFLGYSGNFYINEDGGWSVVSDIDIKVEFNPTTGFAGINDLASRIPGISTWSNRDNNTLFFKEFTLVTPDGCRYTFGGVDAIDFSIPYYSRTTEDIIATSWHLSRIVTPEGYTVSFSYLSTGSQRPVMLDIRYVPGFRSVQYIPSGPGTVPTDVSYNTGRRGFTGFLLYGCDLEKISTPNETISMYHYADLQYETAYSRHAGDALYWSDGEKRQGTYTPVWDNPSLQFLQLINARAGSSDNQTRGNIASSLRCNVLHRIAIDCNGADGHDQSIYFEQGGTGRRKLRRIVWRAGIPEIINRPIIGGGVAYPYYEIPINDSGVDMPEYKLTYNPGTFPAGYVFPQTDRWGYYTGKDNSPADIFNIGQPTFDINPLATEYETLTGIQYPTGGSSVFEYEGNDYSRKVTAACEEPVSDSGTSGGLRIRSITDKTREGGIASIVRYHYKESLTSRESSGIAALEPPFSMTYIASGSQSPPVQYVLHLVSGSGFPPPVTNLNTPDVGYSSVIEERLDANGESIGYTKYVYSNYGTDIYGISHNDEPAQYAYNCTATQGVPYSSRSIERGKLLSKQFYSREGRLVRREDTRYGKVCNDSILTADQRLINFSMQDHYATANIGWLTWTYTYSYLPVSTKAYQYDGPVLYSEKQAIGYNGKRLPAFKETFVGTSPSGGAEDIKRESFTYPSDDARYSWMADAHILSPVVSYKVSRGDSWSRLDYSYANCGLNSGDVLPYLQRVNRSTDGHPEPWLEYETLSVERHGKPTEIWQDSRNSILWWGSTGQVLTMRLDNMTQSKFDSLLISRPMQQPRLDVIVPISREQLSRNAAFLNTCSYNGNLQITRTTAPDDVENSYEYDALRRLRRVYYVKAPGHQDKTISTYVYRYYDENDTTQTGGTPETTIPDEVGTDNVTFSGGSDIDVSPGPDGPVIPPIEPIQSYSLKTGYATGVWLKWYSAANLNQPGNYSCLLDVEDTVTVNFRISEFAYNGFHGGGRQNKYLPLRLALWRVAGNEQERVSTLPFEVNDSTFECRIRPSYGDSVILRLPPGTYDLRYQGTVETGGWVPFPPSTIESVQTIPELSTVGTSSSISPST
ncbi:MAG: hypothetical protein NC308_04035, partial [Clostridium sp.]|nr:hypothetical protein [Clostridium sp.]